jgi:hypothetical protein
MIYIKEFFYFLNENSNNKKNVKEEFDIIKDSRFFTIKQYTLNDIVDNWNIINNNDNHNIKTIKYFVDNPNILKSEFLYYDKKGLSDGYHRLTAMKIVGLDDFFYKNEDY